MKGKILTQKLIAEFSAYLQSEEKSANTIEKYLRDVRAFAKHITGTEITKENVIAYKNELMSEGYAARSINSMLASLNSLFSFLGWSDCKVKSLKLQQQIYCPEEKELTKAEYMRLVNTAKQKGNERLNLLIQTICGTGIRVSELQYITVEAVRCGEAVVSLKGKTRLVFIVRDLQKKLLCYAAEQKITSGAIFVTRNGKPISRTNIWREMKALCCEANVDPQKVFPHNLRHLFARVFYGIEKDIAKLADILGHSSINTTRIYIISTGTEHRQRMENMRLII
ncbi:MAG: tyrosine-type recombinase/integrase [Oscillospiraceae bacterium]|nr:tyrosine-type recombinase/integrase [Oscillospiraceae bacterium]